MPTLKKRINLSVPSDLETALDDLRDATGASPASFIVEIMTQAIPMIRNITAAAIEAKKSPQNALLLMQHAIDQGIENAHRKADLFEQETRKLRKSPKPKANKSDQPDSQVVERKKVGRPRRQIQAEQPEA